MDFKIEKMTISDLEEIKDVLEKDFDDFWKDNTLKEELLSNYSYFITIKLSKTNEILGFAGFKKTLDTADIMNIVVRKDFRNKKIGKKLLTSLIQKAKEQDIKTIFLEVNSKNLPALKLYENIGFKKIGIRKNYYKNSDGINMKIELD